MDIAAAEALVQGAFSSLRKSGLVDKAVECTPETVLLGEGTVLDSIGFVTLISDVEMRVSDSVGDEVFLVLNEIQEFNSDNPFLDIRTLSSYISTLVVDTAK